VKASIGKTAIIVVVTLSRSASSFASLGPRAASLGGIGGNWQHLGETYSARADRYDLQNACLAYIEMHIPAARRHEGAFSSRRYLWGR